ncbi:hypothetical protein SOASR030_11910 [Leminorella grimontii]|uniref:Transposase n=1 Tax=Leminorella grimontii TaxID=82981 RepID=A0AAV5N255_9GAMM|nr:hypothetical protein SOASR030_11910 [Leminorella grimontii]GKX58503.1 hypothetical protein SOASR031_08180 [Leminorella grimontii]
MVEMRILSLSMTKRSLYMFTLKIKEGIIIPVFLYVWHGCNTERSAVTGLAFCYAIRSHL